MNPELKYVGENKLDEIARATSWQAFLGLSVVRFALRISFISLFPSLRTQTNEHNFEALRALVDQTIVFSAATWTVTHRTCARHRETRSTTALAPKNSAKKHSNSENTATASKRQRQQHSG